MLWHISWLPTFQGTVPVFVIIVTAVSVMLPFISCLALSAVSRHSCVLYCLQCQGTAVSCTVCIVKAQLCLVLSAVSRHSCVFYCLQCQGTAVCCTVCSVKAQLSCTVRSVKAQLCLLLSAVSRHSCVFYCLQCQGTAVFWTELKNFSFHFILWMTELMY
jgi:hypothetical protein